MSIVQRKRDKKDEQAIELYREQIRKYTVECERLGRQVTNLTDTLTRCQEECTKLLLEKRTLVKVLEELVDVIEVINADN